MSMESPNYQWYAIYTRASYEKKLFNSLMEKNIECFLPTRKVKKDWMDRKRWIDEPLFHCYLFVKVSYQEFFTALNTPGVICYISSGGKAQAIPEIQIENIKTFLSQTDYDMALTFEQITKGQSIEIKNGALKGIQGEIININGQRRLLIRLDSLKCGLYINLSETDIFVERNDFKEPVFSRSFDFQNN